MVHQTSYPGDFAYFHEAAGTYCCGAFAIAMRPSIISGLT